MSSAEIPERYRSDELDREHVYDGAPRLRANGEGYEYVTDLKPESGRQRPVYVHRLAFVAWHGLGSLPRDHDVHHDVAAFLGLPEEAVDGSIPWLNAEEALTAEEAHRHRARTLRNLTPEDLTTTETMTTDDHRTDETTRPPRADGGETDAEEAGDA